MSKFIPIVPPRYFNTDDILTMDIETDALKGYTTIHCIVAKDLEGNVTEIIQPLERPDEKTKLVDLLEKHRGGSICGHFFLDFDYPALDHLLPGLFDRDSIIDSLVVSRLLNFSLPGGHSIEAWGPRLGFVKKHADLEDFKTFSREIVERCHSDVEINHALLEKRLLRFLRDPAWHYSIWLEHEVAKTCQDMHKIGLPYNRQGAEDLKNEIIQALKPIDEAIERDFPPQKTLVRTFTARSTQQGTLNIQDFRWASLREFTVDTLRPGVHCVTLGDRRGDSIPELSVFSPGDVIRIYEMVPFNPGSTRQIVERLNAAGWKPTDKTKGHINALKDKKTPKEKLEQFEKTGWKISEENLKTVPDTAPESAKSLAKRLILASRLRSLEEWINSIDPETGKIHPEFSGIGAWTHRVSHSKPNSANTPVAKRSPKDSEFETFVNDINDRMRANVYAPEGKILVGTDADGIQMRIFAHLVGDPRLIKALVEGNKEDGTDIHTLHQGFLGDVCKSRDVAKTFIYAFLLGAGTGKISEILQCSFGRAKEAVAQFLEAYPGLKELKQTQIPKDAERGYFVGLDGRKVACSSEHLMLSGYLQNGEKVIMATAEYIWKKAAREARIPFWMINWVHDEWQTLTEDDPAVYEALQKIQVDSFSTAGEILRLRCPLAGDSDVGYTWKETH